MRNWLFCKTRNFAKRLVCFAKLQNSFRIEFRETKSETSFAGNPIGSFYFVAIFHNFLKVYFYSDTEIIVAGDDAGNKRLEKIDIESGKTSEGD
jgi:hypothetical protein